MNKPGWPVLAAVAVAIVVIGILAGALIAGNGEDGEQTIVTVPTSVDATAAGGASGPVEPTIEDDDVPLGKAEARRVATAAEAAAGGGEVVEISRSDDPGEAYEVEVITDRGELDIALDDNLKRVDNQAYDD